MVVFLDEFGYQKASVVVAAILLAISSFQVVWNIFFHPLRNFPGPLAWGATGLCRHYRLTSGKLGHDLVALHKRYGGIVRIAPNELSVVDARGWKDIYGPRKSESGPKELPKNKQFYQVFGPGSPESIFSADLDKHATIRNSISPAFSERNLRATEPILHEYVDLFIRRLRENSQDGSTPVDLSAWFNYLTFDLSGRLTLGSAFDCLRNSKYHVWVSAIVSHIKEMTYLHFIAYLGLGWVPGVLLKSSIFKGMALNEYWMKEKIKLRMKCKDDETLDYFDGLLKLQDELSMDEIFLNAVFIILASSESSATLLAATTYFLLTNPPTLEKLVNEVRSSFENEADITVASVTKLPFLKACLHEGLRLHHALPVGTPRVTPVDGAEIAGTWVPGNTTVSMHFLATFTSSENFTEPRGFHPERFMGDVRFATDKMEAFQPFSFGPRKCIGQSLGHATTRLALAKLIFNFDLDLAPESLTWIEQKAYLAWQKPKLNVFLKEIRQ